MKRIILVLGILALVGGSVYADMGDAFTVNNFDGSVEYLNIDENGVVTFSSSVVNVSQPMFDVALASVTAIVNNRGISTSTLLASGTTWLLAASFVTDGFITPRNMTAVAYCNNLTSASVTGSMVITGVNSQGESASETLTITTNTATGNVAFASLVSIAITASAITNLHASEVVFKIGAGVKIGLVNNVNADNDVYNVNEAGAKTTGYTVSTTYNTISFESAPNGSNEYTVIYKTNGRE